MLPLSNGYRSGLGSGKPSKERRQRPCDHRSCRPLGLRTSECMRLPAIRLSLSDHQVCRTSRPPRYTIANCPAAVLLALHDDARSDAIPFFEGSRGRPFTDQNGFAAAEQVAREEGLPGNDGAGLVEAHDRVPQATHKGLGRSRFVPAAAPEIFIDEVAAVRLQLSA